MEPDILEELKVCETAVWQALADGDMAADSRALDDGFLGVYPTGFADKAAHVGQLSQGPTIETFSLSDFHLIRLGDGYALLAYHADFRRLGRGAEQMYVSSVWRRDGTVWKNVLSQDTPATTASEV